MGIDKRNHTFAPGLPPGRYKGKLVAVEVGRLMGCTYQDGNSRRQVTSVTFVCKGTPNRISYTKVRRVVPRVVGCRG